MMEIDLSEKMRRIMARDDRYDTEAYRFLSEALDYTICSLGREKYSEDEKRHASGKELLEGVREYGLMKFGPLTRTVLEHWGICSCEDFGEIVFNIVEEGVLKKTESDSKEDFKGGFSFYDAFEKPFET